MPGPELPVVLLAEDDCVFTVLTVLAPFEVAPSPNGADDSPESQPVPAVIASAEARKRRSRIARKHGAEAPEMPGLWLLPDSFGRLYECCYSASSHYGLCLAIAVSE